MASASASAASASASGGSRLSRLRLKKANACPMCVKHTTEPESSESRIKTSFNKRFKGFFKGRAPMDSQVPVQDSPAELTRIRGLRDLTTTWFIQTQLPQLLQNGLYPPWFLGFISRTEAEDLLREKTVGSFLLRLSLKAVGFILSYRGTDRCRHFVINQTASGQFVVSGDVEGHNTVQDLVRHYRTKPVQPFGEYLTSACFQVPTEDLYDTVTVVPTDKSPAALGSVVTELKQRANGAKVHRVQTPRNISTAEVLPRPERSRPLPRHTRQDQDQDRVLYAHLKKQPPRERPARPPRNRPSGDPPWTSESRTPPSRPEPFYSEPTRARKPRDNSYARGRHYPPPRRSPQPVRRVPDSWSQDSMDHSGIYHLAGGPRTAPPDANALSPRQWRNPVYDEVPYDASPYDASPYDASTYDASLYNASTYETSTYETIPESEDSRLHKLVNNTYESPDDVRTTMLTNDTRRIFPEVERKW